MKIKLSNSQITQIVLDSLNSKLQLVDDDTCMKSCLESIKNIYLLDQACDANPPSEPTFVNLIRGKDYYG